MVILSRHCCLWQWLHNRPTRRTYYCGDCGGVANFFLTFIEVLEDRQGTSPEGKAWHYIGGDYLSGLLQGLENSLKPARFSYSDVIPQVNPRTVGR